MSGRPREVTRTVLAGVIEAAPDGVLLADDEGTILLANRRMELLFGYSKEELLGQPVELLVPEHLREGHRSHRAAFARSRTTRLMGFGLPVFGLRRDGTEFAAEIRLGPLQTDDGARTIAIVRDLFDHLEVELRAIGANDGAGVRDERQSMVRELNDRVSERLFAAGMAVQSAYGIASGPFLRDRLGRALEEIDSAIVDLRSPMFEPDPDRAPESLRARVIAVCAEMHTELGLAPSTRFLGPVETADARVVETLLVVLREALSGVAQRAGASSVAVTLTAGDGLALVVDLDGVGPSVMAEEPMGGRLRALVARARELGGTLFVGPNGASGTRLEWRVPIR
ncbi:MAG: PAS domain-containing sensor histidine kinase [Acidimicrobiales bacterium]